MWDTYKLSARRQRPSMDPRPCAHGDGSQDQTERLQVLIDGMNAISKGAGHNLQSPIVIRVPTGLLCSG